MPANAMNVPTPELTDRQREILRSVIEEYVTTGQPVGSKYLVDRADLRVSSSTVRAELSELERRGLLTHPHTSAGRVPTESGYRFYVDQLLDRLQPRPDALALDFSAARNEVDAALRTTTEILAQVTRLLALASAPPLETASVRHVEVLLLQPRVVMVVVITSTGGVSSHTALFPDPVDLGIINWASEYLNDRLRGQWLGAHVLRRCFEDSALPQRERTFLAELRPAFAEVARGEQRIVVGGAAGLLEELRAEELGPYRRLMEMLEQRVALIDLLARSVEPLRPFVRVGDELDIPELNRLSLVGASYGLVNQAFGAVSLVGPLRMDYEKAIRSVRSAAYELTRYLEEIYGEN
jgi:heat-inducible transcriptional repressor